MTQTDGACDRLPFTSSAGSRQSSGSRGCYDDHLRSDEETLNESSHEVFQSSRHYGFPNLGEVQLCGCHSSRACREKNSLQLFSVEKNGGYLSQLETCQEERRDVDFLPAVDHHSRSLNTRCQCYGNGRRDFESSSCYSTRKHGHVSFTSPPQRTELGGHQCSCTDHMCIADGTCRHHGNNGGESQEAGLKIVKLDKCEQHCPLCLVRSHKVEGHHTLNRTSSIISSPAECDSFEFKNKNQNSALVAV